MNPLLPLDAATTITTAAADFLPQMTLVAAAAIGVGAGILVFRRGWSFFKGLAK